MFQLLTFPVSPKSETELSGTLELLDPFEFFDLTLPSFFCAAISLSICEVISLLAAANAEFKSGIFISASLLG